MLLEFEMVVMTTENMHYTTWYIYIHTKRRPFWIKKTKQAKQVKAMKNQPIQIQQEHLFFLHLE